jgi:hypothetical protein
MRATFPFVLGAAVLLLAACGRHEALITTQAPSGAVMMENPGTDDPAYVGRWATSARGCVDRAWVLTRQNLHSANGLVCTFVKLEPGSAGYGGDVDCGAPGQRKAGRMTLTLTGSGASRGLTLVGGPFDLPVTLDACPAGAPASQTVAAR